MLRLEIVSLPLCALLSWSAQADVFQPRRHQGPECGVKSYATKADPSCGVKRYHSGKGASCGVQSYREGSGPVCGETCSTHCKKRNIFNQCTKRETTCTYNTCVDRSFGVQTYKQCVHPDFGVLEYNRCSKAEFGVEEYQTCRILKTSQEIEAYIANVQMLTPELAGLYTLKKGFLLTHEGLRDELACLIRASEQDVLSMGLVESLKASYQSNFGESVHENLVSCEEEQPVSSFLALQEFCVGKSLSELEKSLKGQDSQYSANRVHACLSVKSLEMIEGWFTTKIAEIQTLMNDSVARHSAEVREKLINLKREVAASRPK